MPPSNNDELVVGGLKVSVIAEKYEAEYVGSYSIPGTGDGPFLVFYRDTLNQRELDLGFDNYFGMYRRYGPDGYTDDVRIFNAKKIRDAEFSAIEVGDGEYICSRAVHNMVGHPSGAWLDGGPFYTRYNPAHPPTHIMRIVDGKETFSRIKKGDKAPSTLPVAGVEPAVIAEFTDVPNDEDYSPNGMTMLLADVGAFHTAADQPVRTVPKMPSREEMEFRIRLIREELEELEEACQTMDIVEVADALGDIVYVTVGAAHHFGIPLDRCWQEIQSTNMAKVDPATGKVRKRADGKVLKPSGWQPPNIPRALGIIPEVLN
jgi:Uncharacterized protein conserved in bacteria